MWGPKDEFIMCCGNDGGLYEWKFTEESKWERKERNLDIKSFCKQNDYTWDPDDIIEKYKDKSTEGKKFAPM